MQYLMVFACKMNWRPVGVPVSTAEALRRFRPVRMVVSTCPQCGGMHVYSMNEGHLKVWDDHAMHDAGKWPDGRRPFLEPRTGANAPSLHS